MRPAHYYENSSNSLPYSPTTSNARGDGAVERRNLVTYAIFFIACVGLATFVIVSNVLFILACWKTSALRTIANKYVLSLATADMTLGMSMYIQGAFYISVDGNSLRSIKFLCLTLMSVISVGLTSSMLSVMLIAIDRYIYIVLPYRYPRLVTARRTTVIIIVAWIFSILYGTVPMYNNHFSDVKGCSATESRDKNYATSRLVLFLMSCCISGFCHLSIQCTAIQHIKKLYPTRYQPTGTYSKPTGSQLHLKNANKHMHASLKPIKSFFLVYILFVHSWMPGLILYSVGSTNKVLLHTFAIIAELSTGLNVLVYVFSNRQFKAAIGKIMKCSVTADPLSGAGSQPSSSRNNTTANAL